MASKRKKNGNGEGPVKIVGINHGLCLAFTLFLDGWKRERYADVTFYCKPSDKEKNNRGNPRKKLRANRSVLAAASPFFASILPDCELENDVCVTTELLYDEMFCVLEYIYSGKLLCSIEKKEKLLHILKDFQVFVPVNVREEEHDERYEPEIEIVIEDEAEDAGKDRSFDDNGDVSSMDHFSDSNSVHIDLQLEDGGLNRPEVISSLNADLNIVLPNSSKSPVLKSTNVGEALRSYSKKKVITTEPPPLKKISKSPVTAFSGAISVVKASSSSLNAFHGVGSKSSKVEKSDLEQDSTFSDFNNLDSVSNFVLDKDAVTIQFPNTIVRDETKKLPYQVEKDEMKKELKSFNSTGYQLSTYLTHTWSYGIYSNTEKWTENSLESSKCSPRPEKAQNVVHNWTAFRQPTFLTTRPQRVYIKGHLRNQLTDSNKAVLKLTDIQNMKQHNGKIHVTLNGKPMVQASLPQLFHGGGDYDSNSVDVDSFRSSRKSLNSVESDEDKIDFALAKHFMQEEVKKKQRLQIKLKMFSERLVQYKHFANLILKTKKEVEKKRKNAVSAPPVKKSGPQVQCEQCGKMVLAARLSIHLKIHSGIKSHLCELCGRTFILKAYLNAHIRINHRGTDRPKRFMCSVCAYTCDQRHKLEVHERTHTDERPFNCTFCDKKFREKGTLVRHLRTHTGEKPYSCNICGTAYAARDTYVQHYKRKHESRPDGSVEPRQRAKHSNVVIYRCEFCEKGFYRVLAYEKHRATHTGVAASVRCSQGDCDFTYSDMTQLKDHMAICHPGKVYTCGICSKTFLTKQNLANHQSKHDPNLGFHCSYCSMSLTTKSSLIAHEKTHTREKPFVCSVCGMSFHSPYLIKIHMRKHQSSQSGSKRKRAKRPVEEEIQETESIEYF